MKKISGIIFMFILIGVSAGCGGDQRDASGGAVAIKIEKATGFDPAISHGHVEKYIVRISGADMEPIVGEFSGDADEGVIDGVPVGNDRQISVTAQNGNDRTIYAGDKADVRVSGGMNDIYLMLDQVPVFANLDGDSTIHAGRFRIDIFSEPEAPLSITRTDGNADLPVVDASTSAQEFYTSQSTWMGSVAPDAISAGWQVFTITNHNNNRSSSVRLKIIDSDSEPAPLSAAVVHESNYSASVEAIR